ncbi:competence protein ComEC [Micromonospora olivasterospora]|uniref:Competence protein ComEC n=1 Tax=Micromonospora olivasterospora TaxID=1880 RepID=A0A562I4X5_MICOL|nr:competence protein ComEC [Micromonospora olivasterospora]
MSRPAEPAVGAATVPDLRLAGLAVAAWLAALTSLHLAAHTAAALAAGAAGLAALGSAHLLAVLGRPAPTVRRYGWIAVAVLLGVVCGATATAARLAVRDAPAVRALVDDRAAVDAELVVRDDPRPARGSTGGPATLLVRAELVALTTVDGRRVAAPLRVLVLATDPAWRGLLPGQRLTAEGRLGAPRGGDLTAAVLAARTAPVLHGPPPWSQRGAGTLRAGLQRACEPLPDEQGGLLPGLVVGDTSRLPPTVEEDFRATGMTHLNAVSGSNVAIVVGAVLLLARWGRAGPWLAAGLCAVALVGFVILVRPSPSVVRAATMGAIGLAALAAGRPRPPCRRSPRRWPSWCWSTRTWPGIPGSRCPCWPPAACCCSPRPGGTRCAGGACRPGWPRRSPCRPPRSSPAARWSPGSPGR